MSSVRNEIAAKVRSLEGQLQGPEHLRQENRSTFGKQFRCELHLKFVQPGQRAIRFHMYRAKPAHLVAGRCKRAREESPQSGLSYQRSQSRAQPELSGQMAVGPGRLILPLRVSHEALGDSSHLPSGSPQRSRLAQRASNGCLLVPLQELAVMAKVISVPISLKIPYRLPIRHDRRGSRLESAPDSDSKQGMTKMLGSGCAVLFPRAENTLIQALARPRR